jgi:hypothetical protein
VIDQHYTVGEVAERLHLSESSVRNLFSGLPGVVTIERPRLRGKRVYTTLRISESALCGWYERHSGGPCKVQPSGSVIEKPLVARRKASVEAFSSSDRGVA